jgi:hypothetical protein
MTSEELSDSTATTNGSLTPQALKDEAIAWLREFMTDEPDIYFNSTLDGYNVAVATIMTVQTNVAALIIQAALSMEKQEVEKQALSVMQAEGSKYDGIINPIQ